MKAFIKNSILFQKRQRLLSHVFVTAMVLIPCGAQCADSAAPHQTEEKNVEMPAKYFINKNFLRCGGKDVLILTSCVDDEESVSFCFNQHINIYDNKTSLSPSINYNYTFNESHEQFINHASCERVNGEVYLILRSATFGNCGRCEWIDVYSVNGKYIGSSEGMYDSRNFTHFPLSRKLGDLLLSTKASETASTEILDVRPHPVRDRTTN